MSRLLRELEEEARASRRPNPAPVTPPEEIDEDDCRDWYGEIRGQFLPGEDA